MIRTLCLASALFATSAAATASAQTAPLDMKGTWKMDQETILEGATPHNPANAESKPAGKYRLRQQVIIYKVDGQDGRRFWGNSTTAEHGAEHRLIGMISPDGKWVYMAGTASLMEGTIVDSDTVELCVRQATPTTALVGCGQMKRQK